MPSKQPKRPLKPRRIERVAEPEVNDDEVLASLVPDASRYIALMPTTKRATIYLDAPLHRALRLKAAETDASISDLVNTAVRHSLAEDADDLAAFHDRVREPRVSYDSVVRDLKKRGKL